MSKEKIRLVAVVPGAANLKPVLEEFLAKGPGIVSAFSDSQLRVLKMLVKDDSDTVKSFGDVVGSFITRLQGQKLLLAQAGHIEAATSEACFNLPEDSVLAPSSQFAGTHRKIARALADLRDWGFDADSLDGASDKLEGELANKLKSLTFVEREVGESLRSIARERNADRVAASIGLAGESTDLGRLLIVAGSQISPTQIDWIRWAAEAGASITLIFDAPAGDLFQDARLSMEKMGGKAKTVGKPNRLQSNLFTAIPEGLFVEGGPDVAIVSAPDTLAECEWALREVLAELSNEVELSNIALYCRNPDGYLPLLKAAAQRFEVPLSCSSRGPLLGNSFAKLTLDFLEFCVSDDVRTLNRLLRSSYLALEIEQREACEQALKDAYIRRHEQWSALEGWVEEHEEEGSWLTPLLEWRKDYLRDPATLSTWCERLVEFGQQPWHEEALNGTEKSGVRDGYAQSAMQRSLAQYASIDRTKGKRNLSLAQFARTCRRIWEAAEVSAPTDIEAVQVVSSVYELGELQSVYVLGMLEGVFPRRRSEDPILTDADRAAISALFPDRLPLPNSHSRARAERDEFYRICGAATNRLVFSYPETDDDRDNVRAFYLVEVERALDKDVKFINHARSEITPLEPLAEADARLQEALKAAAERPLPNILVREDAKETVSRKAKSFVTPSDLSEVLQCPFRFLAHETLELAPNRRRSRWHNLFSLPAKTGLASLPIKEAAEKALDLALESQLSKLYSDTAEHDLALIRAGGKRLLGEWLEREFASREMWPRDQIIDKPSFENGQMRSKLKAGEGYIYLKGDAPALSYRNGYKILHLFRAAEPWQDGITREDRPWDRLKEKEAFEFGLYLLALSTTTSDKVGLEVDSATGSRNLFLMPRPTEPFKNNQASGFKVTVIDQEDKAELVRSTAKNIQVALRRIQDAEVDAEPGDYCRTCEYGELCRRHLDFGEEEEPFAGRNFESSSS
jgi:PD-(D/E)XK nuclease superfamily